jgi:triosephosphate isomerase
MITKKVTPKKPIVIANWKASTLTYVEAEKKIRDIYKNIHTDISKIQLTIAPTIAHTAMLASFFSGKILFTKKNITKNKKNTKKEVLPKVVFAAQDISVHEGGSKTGEVPVKAVKDSGVTKVIIGHSECRERGDTIEMIITKVKHALDAKLEVILCVGERERDSSVAYLKVIDEQITSVFNAIDKILHTKITIAYEPVWAINNKDNKSLDAHGLHSMVVYIRKLLTEKYGEETSSHVHILYGGSVTPENAQDIYWNGEVQGLLIGRASFDPSTLACVIKNILINPKKNILKTYGTHKKTT